MASFDIVCEVNMQEVTNGVDQTRREIGNRYDFRGSNCESGNTQAVQNGELNDFIKAALSQKVC